MQRSKAFTLIELLVVIAIIAILAAILFPVFAQAKEAAKKTQSISNQKQVATSTILYVNDYDDTFPMSAYFMGQNDPVGRPMVFSVYNAVFPYLKNKDVFVSPSNAPGQDWVAKLNKMLLGAPTDFKYTSYSPNLGLFGENFCQNAPAVIDKHYSNTYTTTSLEVPVQTIMFFDGHVQSGPGLDYKDFLAQARSGDGVVVNFADGHAKWFRWNGVPTGGKFTDYGVTVTNAGTRTTYYSWTPGTLKKTDAELDAAASAGTLSNPYNDLHGVPGTTNHDSLDLKPCP